SFGAVDRADMLGRIVELDRQVAEAWRLASALALPASYRESAAVVVLGMGGSAIGADLARSLVARHGAAPIVICREYDLPGWVGREHLVIASSYSGNTEETLSAFGQAIERGARLLAITTGGRLAQVAEQEH